MILAGVIKNASKTGRIDVLGRTAFLLTNGVDVLLKQ
jgi:hypothetical protein